MWTNKANHICREETLNEWVGRLKRYWADPSNGGGNEHGHMAFNAQYMHMHMPDVWTHVETQAPFMYVVSNY